MNDGVNVMNFTKAFAVAATAALGATGASAGLIDFTNSATVAGFTNNGGSGSIDGVAWTVTPDPAGELTFSEVGPGPVKASPLAGDNDGLGVTDDETSTTPDLVESITLAFDEVVTITGLYFLDLFQANSGLSAEIALVSVDGAAPVSFTALVPFSDKVGFGAFATKLTGMTFTFTAENTNDAVGLSDYALAAVELAPIPLPAGVLLLGTALAGLGMARRRKAA